jgi:hypothetical protein
MSRKFIPPGGLIALCRECAARKKYNKCLGNLDRINTLLKRARGNRHTAPAAEPICSRCRKHPAVHGMKYCSECMVLRWHKCATPNCETLTSSTYCHSCAGVLAHTERLVMFEENGK